MHHPVRICIPHNGMMNNRISRRRSRATVALAIFACSAALAPSEIQAYIAASAPARPLLGTSSSVHRGSAMNTVPWSRVDSGAVERLWMASSSATESSAAQCKSRRRLSRDEEQEVLRDALELKRIKKLEQDLALKSATLDLPMLSVRAKQAGYGSDWEAYEDAKERGHAARESLVTHNMGLVHYCVTDIMGASGASKRRLNSLSREDLVQEGAIGLARAVDKFNPAMNTKFSTYSVYWIRAAILRCIAERDDLMRVPEHVSVAIRKTTAAAQRLGFDANELSPLWREAEAAKRLAEEAGLTDKQLKQAIQVKERRRMGGYISFESWMQKGKDMDSDVVTSSTSSSLDVAHIVEALSPFLRPKEIEALSLRYGLHTNPASAQKPYRDYLAEAEEEIFGEATPALHAMPVKGKWGEAMSFTEVGKHMSISAEYGRRLCHKALDKLKRAAAEGQLEPAFLY